MSTSKARNIYSSVHAHRSLTFLSLSSLHSARSANLVECLPVDASAPQWLRGAKIYSIRGLDGFRLIRCPFADAAAQLRLVRSALRDWIEPPSLNNLGTAKGVTAEDAANYSNMWQRHLDEEASGEPSTSLLSKLTWATVGYQYQWTPRCYDPNCRSPFPAELSTLAAELAHACGWPTLRPEAAIINLYHPASTMGGHRDDAEPDQTSPIVSISLGLDCVYLLGGETKDTPPIAMRLRSGDVIVQGGRSRGYVHGVPRVLAGTLPTMLRPENAADSELSPFARWLLDHRLNINVRQVFEAEVEGGARKRPREAG